MKKQHRVTKNKSTPTQIDRQISTFLRNSSKEPNHSLQKRIGRNVMRLRKKAKMTQIQLGKILNLHQTAISRIENGTQHLTSEEFFRLSQFFDLKMDEIATQVL